MYGCTVHIQCHNHVDSAIPLVVIRQDSQSASRNEVISEQLMHVGHHYYNDVGGQHAGFQNSHQRYNYMSHTTDKIPLPRDRMHTLVVAIGPTRPTIQPIV